MGNLPEEIVIEILAKSSAESLMRLSCVCKSWRDLIQNPYVGEKHFNNNVNKRRDYIFLRYWSRTEGTREDLLSSHNSRLQKLALTIVGSCNGIICSADYSVYLYNPVTREEKKLPANISGDIKRNSYLGFGYDKYTDDYKVIRIAEHAEVYKLSTDEWSVLDVNLKSEFYFLGNGMGVFLNGCCHWPVRPRAMGSKKILTFDLRDETFGEMAYPGDTLSSHECIGVLDESLAVCMSSRDREIGVWVMSEYGKNGSWTKKFSVKILPPEIRRIVAFWVHDMKIAMLGVHARRPDMEISMLGVHARDERRRVVKCDEVSGAVFQPTFVPLCGRRSKFDMLSV